MLRWRWARRCLQANCAVCHGEQGRGNGPAAASLRVQAARLWQRPSGHSHRRRYVSTGFKTARRTGSPMPAFKDKLSDDDIWHLVNYVRRLRNEAISDVGAGLAPAQAGADANGRPDAICRRCCSPTRRRVSSRTNMGRRQIITPTGDADALALLARSDAAMNALQSLAEDQVVSDDAGNELKVRFEYNAPDRMKYQIADGATSIQIGADDYQPAPRWNVDQECARHGVCVAQFLLREGRDGREDRAR